MQLRDYQQRGVADIRAAFRAKKKRPLFVLPTGGGKTATFVYIANSANSRGNRVLITVHRVELLRQTSAALDRMGVPHGIIAPGYKQTREGVQVCMVQTMQRRLEKLQFQPDLIIVDECFPAGTLVDGRPIESLKPGDVVSSVNHSDCRVEERQVIAMMTREYLGDWYRVRTSTGRSVVCTENHPFFVVGYGYVKAKDLQSHGAGATLFEYELPELRGNNSPRPQTQDACLQVLQQEVPRRGGGGLCSGKAAPEAVLRLVRRGRDLQEPKGAPRGLSRILIWKVQGLLLGLLQEAFCLKEKLGGHAENKHGQQGRDFRSHEEKQSNEKRLGQEKDGRRLVWKDFSCARRQWEGNTSATEIGPTVQPANGVRSFDISCKGAIRKLTKLLQGRSCLPGSQTGDRGRREVPQAKEVEVSRRQKNEDFVFSGLESVEVYKRAGGHRPDWVPRSNTVHNIHVEGNNNYFAGGILVHNCHHAVAGQWSSILKAYPAAHVLGVTATPVRSDGKPLGDVFDTMIEGPTIRELIAQQHLVKPVVFCPPVLLDTTGVRKRGGDYASGDLAAATNKPAITGDAVAHYRKLLNGAPAIAFCASVKHAEDVAEDFRRQGFRWAAVHGDMEPEDRRRTLDELGRGLLNGVSSCDVISEGTDIPAVHAAILLRKTESVGLYLQQVGRALRPAPGKDRAIIIDHVGNIGRMEGGKFAPKHDLPDVDREWSLDGEENGRPRSASESKVKNRQCPKCYEVHELAPRCPHCGHVYNYEKEHRVIDAELHHVDDEQRVQAEHHAKVERRRMVAEAKTGEDLARIAKMYGHKPGWIYHMAALKGISLR